MKAKFGRLLKLLTGWTLVLLGVIGWFTPVLPGTLFIVLGLAILSAQSEWVRNRIESVIDSLRILFPRHAAKLQRLKKGLASKIRREGAP